MRVLVNALSVGSISGRHVLYGHLRQIAEWSLSEHEFIVLKHPEEILPECLPSNVSPLNAPARTRKPMLRTAWEFVNLPKVVRKHSIDLLFTPSGTITPTCPVPQISLAQNPWCLAAVQRGASEHLKASIQRKAYRIAWRNAGMMAYNSEHMRDLYFRNGTGTSEAKHIIVYQGINDNTHEAAVRHSGTLKDPNTILSVSAMAHWKGAIALVKAHAKLLKLGLASRLELVGPWPDERYRLAVDRAISEMGTSKNVEITGKVSVDELHRRYAKATVFCLMSRCESFGIPAVEAQAFGTPVIGSNICATAEICGKGGLYSHPDNQEELVKNLSRVLSDPSFRERLSSDARRNADRFRWSLCSRPLMQMFSLLQQSKAR